jgi:4-hydroxy-tetrahydrodipicolinate synthase
MKIMISNFLRGKVKEAGGIHRKLLPIFEGIFITTNPSPVKFALKTKGLPVGKV